MNRMIAVQINTSGVPSTALKAWADEVNPEQGQYNRTCAWIAQESITSGMFAFLDEITYVLRLTTAWLLVPTDDPRDGMVLADGSGKLTITTWAELDGMRDAIVWQGEGQNVYVGSDLNSLEFAEE